jgi:hypothetical protein
MDAVFPPVPSLEEAGDGRRTGQIRRDCPRQDGWESHGAPLDPPPELPGIEILERVGRGARGCVYRATDGTRTFAVKVLRRGVSVDRAVLERLLRTPAAPGRIRHPSIAPIEAIGEAPAGCIHYLMPLLRGDPLEKVLCDLKRGTSDRPSLGPLAVEPDGGTHPQLARRAAETFAEAAEGLAAAHREGIVHRRLHPGNLIFSPAGRLVITDFGGVPTTAGGEALAYVAPEQLEPFPERVGPPADVYSLGVMLYEILTRRLPFGAESPQELKKAILKGRCPVPRSLRSDVPAGLEAAVLKAMARDPADRYADAGELAEEIRRFLDHETPIALWEARATRRAPPGHGERGPAHAAVRRPGAMSPRARLAGVALVIVSAGAVAWWAGDRVFGLRERGPRVVSLNPAAVRTVPRGGEPSATAVPGAARRDPAAAGGSLARASGVGPREPALRLDGRAFAALGEAIERAGTEEDSRLFCLWDIEASGVLDAAPRPAEVVLPPNLRIDLDPDAPRDFTARAIRMLAVVDPAAILHPHARRAIDRGLRTAEADEASLLARREDLFRELSRALAAAGARHGGSESDEAIAALAAIAREEYLTSAADALAALAELGAHDALVEIARAGDLPLPLREAALSFLGMDLAGLASDDLRSIALSSPEPGLRRLAFVRLAAASPPAAAAIVARVVDDPGLRDEALSSLAALDPFAAGAALDLLEHPEPAVRAQASRFLAATTAEVSGPLALLLLSPRRAARETALAVILERGEVSGIPRPITAALGFPEPGAAARRLLLEDGLAAARGFAAAVLRGLREGAAFLGRRLDAIRLTRL